MLVQRGLDHIVDARKGLNLDHLLDREFGICVEGEKKGEFFSFFVDLSRNDDRRRQESLPFQQSQRPLDRSAALSALP